MRRGEVWWARLDAPAGRRPVVLVSRDDAYERRQFVMAGPVTTRVRGIPSEVGLGPEDGLPRRCVANLDSLLTLPRALLETHICDLSGAKMAALDKALRYALGLG